MVINRKYELILTKDQESILDIVSNNLRTSYNDLLNLSNKDYKENNNSLKLTQGYNLRDYFISIRKDTPCANYHSPIVKTMCIRLKNSFTNFFKYGKGYPNFKAFSNKWFSLYYDEPRISPKVGKDGLLLVKLGSDFSGNNLNFKCGIVGYIRNESIRTSIITKNKSTGKYYITYTVEIPDKPIKESVKSKDWIAIDPNHKNFFCAVDSDHKSIEVSKVNIVKTLDLEIDKVKSKRDLKKRHSRRWLHLDKVLKKLYHKREEQIKNSLYEVANYLVKRYNVIIIGDYTPDVSLTKSRQMRKSMLNQTHIGSFRKILKHVCNRYGKKFIIEDERNTTKKCCITGIMVKREPEIREWFIGDRLVLRDLNSSVNIASKSIYIDTEYINKVNLSSIDVNIKVNYNKKLKICLAQTILKKDVLHTEFKDNETLFYTNNWLNSH